MFRRPPLASAILLMLAVPAAVYAGNFDYQVSAGAGHSDNVTRVAEDEQDEDIATAGLKFSYDEKTRKLTADLVGNFDYQKYLDDSFDDELVGSFAGNLAIDFIPERFKWTVSDNFGQVLADPFLPATPLNRENINFFSTGPDVNFNFGSQNRLNLAARYLRTDYETSPLDSTTTLGEIGFGRSFSSVNSLSLNARMQQVEFKEADLQADYDQTDAFLRYTADGARTKIDVDAGVTQIDRDVGEDSDSPLVKISAARQLSRASTLTLLAGREYANSGSAFAESQGAGPISVDPQAGRQTPEPFQHDYAMLTWNFQLSQTGFSVRAGLDKQEYEELDILNQKFTTYGVTFRRDLSAVTSLQFDAARLRGQFDVTGGKYTDTNAGASFNWGITRTLSLALSYRYADRNGDELTGNYTENRVWLTLNYRRGAPRDERLRPEFPIEAQQAKN
jgi:hypothetical protein